MCFFVLKRRGNVLLRSVILCLAFILLCHIVLLLFKQSFFLSVRIDEVVNLKTKSKSDKWMILKSSYSKTCQFYARVLTNWTVLCITDDRYKIIFENEKVIRRTTKDILKRETLLVGLNDDAIIYYFAIKQRTHTIYTLNSAKVSNHTELRKSLAKFNDEHLTGVLYNATHFNNYTQTPFNSSIYYGCYSTDEYDDINDTHRFPLHCYDGILPAIYTPAYFESSRLEIERCDRKMPDIAVPENNFVHFEFDKSFFSRCSFWFLPVFKPSLRDSGKDEDLAYKCFIQWALWQLNCHISVYWERYLTYDDVDHNLFCLEIIKNFPNCKIMGDDRAHCILKAFKAKFSNESHDNLKNWMMILEDINFQPENFTLKQCQQNSSLMLHPVRQKSKSNSIQYEIPNVHISQRHYQKICSKNVTSLEKNGKFENLENPWIQRPDVLLLLIFNYPHYETIPLLEIMHRPIYPNILYCGHIFPRLNETHPYRISFATYLQPYGHNAGSLNFQCIIKAIRMGYEVDGILAIADDIFIKTELINVSTGKNWFATGGILGDVLLMRQCSSTANCSLPMTWIWWGGFPSSLHHVFKEWSECGESNPDMKLAKQRLANVTGGEMRMYGNTGDIGFLSRKYFKVAYKIFHMFTRNQIFLEITIPTVFNSVTDSNDIFRLLGHADWSNSRNDFWRFIRNATMFGNYFAHPMKLSSVLKKDVNGLKGFCTCIVPYLHDPNQQLCV